jgi:putative ABC transport system ATP-binding protein
MLIADNLQKTYRSGGHPLAALKNVSFTVDPGETVAIVGPSGSGKTTLLGLLAGLDRPSAGRVLLDGTDLGALTEDARARLRREKIGEQQRVALARAFIHRPGILFADEPTGNLDAATGERIIQLILELNRERGTTVVLVTHDPALAGRMGRVVRLADGAVVSDERSGA